MIKLIKILLIVLFPILLLGQTLEKVNGVAIADLTKLNNIEKSTITKRNGIDMPSSFTNAKYFTLNGTDEYADVSSTLDYDAKYTVNSWFQLASGYADYAAFVILGYGASSYFQAPLHFAGVNGYIYHSPSTTLKSVVWNNFDTDWHMYTITRDGTDVKFYIDNSQVGTTQTVPVGEDGLVDYMGKCSGSSYFNGSLDEIAVWKNVVITSGQMTGLYGTGTASGCGNSADISGLTNYWNFENCATTNIPDEAGSDDMTMQNATTSANINDH